VRALAHRGFETFLPLYEGVRRWQDRSKLLSLPLFPCYVFVKGNLDHRLDLVTTPGIHSLVTCAGQIVAIHPDEIEDLRRMVGSGMHVEPHPFLKCGERVRIKHGPLAGVQGILVRKRNLYRLVLSVEMLGKAASVEIDAHSVERMGSGKLKDESPEKRAIAAD
jgi:transcription antitermination factor NusG